MKKILFVASECVPFIKTGGLADVVGSLPKYFDKSEYDVRVMLPKYLCIPEKFRSQMKYVTHFYTDFYWRNQYVGVMEMEYEGIKFYFVDSEFYFGGPWPYSNMFEDIEKFAFYSKAVLSILPLINFQPDIIHCHDWQTGLIPVYLNDSFQGDLFFHNIKTIMTIHNLKFQGTWEVNTIKNVTGLSDYYFTSDKLELYGNGNLLKGGIVYADKISTVSETYAEEIKMPFYGEGLDGLIQARSSDLVGIVNGIDYDFYNPEKDESIAAPYNEMDFETEKVKNKLALQKELGLKQDKDVFMLGVVSRLTSQKGFDLVRAVIEQICAEDVQLVVLGTGDNDYENLFRYYGDKYKDRVSSNIYYSEPMSHKIYAACDAFLMPSLFEPCGLSQLMSLRYGTLPIVRETGGLKDTVKSYNKMDHTGTGFSFANYNAHEMLGIINNAKELYYTDRKEWNDMAKRAMEADFSWNASAKKYQALYDELIIAKEKRIQELLEQKRHQEELDKAILDAKKLEEKLKKAKAKVAELKGTNEEEEEKVEDTNKDIKKEEK